MNWFIYFTFIYERKFLCFFFVLMVLSFLIHPKASLVKHLVHSNLFVPLNRISFSYMGAADSIVYSFYSIYNVQIYINYQNMFFTTMGLIFMITTLSTIFTVLFELPMRIIFKSLSRKKIV